MLNKTRPGPVRTTSDPRPTSAGRSVGTFVTGVARQLSLVDVVEILVLPTLVYVVRRLNNLVKNYVEPERTLLRPRAPRA